MKNLNAKLMKRASNADTFNAYDIDADTKPFNGAIAVVFNETVKIIMGIIEDEVSAFLHSDGNIEVNLIRETGECSETIDDELVDDALSVEVDILGVIEDFADKDASYSLPLLKKIHEKTAHLIELNEKKLEEQQ